MASIGVLTGDKLATDWSPFCVSFLTSKTIPCLLFMVLHCYGLIPF